ncbi:MAG: hypothetical protein WAM60_15495 [Candidatus Promineifilaceae bacterium]
MNQLLQPFPKVVVSKIRYAGLLDGYMTQLFSIQWQDVETGGTERTAEMIKKPIATRYRFDDPRPLK